MFVLPTSGAVESPTPLSAVQRFTRLASEAAARLTSNDRFASHPGDLSSFKSSRLIRNDIDGLSSIVESSQLGLAQLHTANDGLDTILNQLVDLRDTIVGGATASGLERSRLQAQIDFALDELDATVQLTRFGGRSLLDGGSEIIAHKSINAAGVKTDYFTQDGEVAGDQTGVQGVRVNQIGFGAPLRFLDDGSAVVSLNVLIGSLDRARRPALGITQGTAGSFAEFRLTGKFGTTTLRLVSTETNLNQAVVADTFTKDTEFNLQAQDTGLILVPDVFAGAVPTITTLGFGDDDFVHVELIAIDANGGSAPSIGGIGGNSAVGESQTSYGQAATATINGERIKLGGETGTTAHYVVGNVDIEVDVSTNLLDQAPSTAAIVDKVNIELSQGLSALVDPSSRNGVLGFGLQDFSTARLGQGDARQTALIRGIGWPTYFIWFDTEQRAANGNQVINTEAIADIRSGGSLDLSSGRQNETLRVLNRAIDQVAEQQTRLANYEVGLSRTLQGAQIGVATLRQAEIDLTGVDSASEIMTIIASGLGVQTANTTGSLLARIDSEVLKLLN